MVLELASSDAELVTRTVTPPGEEIVEKLIATRRAAIAELCEQWSPDDNEDLAGLLTRLARELLRDAPKPDARNPEPSMSPA